MAHIKNWKNFELSKTNEEFVNIFSKLDKIKFLRGEKLVNFFSNIVPKSLLELIKSEVSKYKFQNLSENIVSKDDNLSEVEKSEIVDTLSKSEMPEIKNDQDIQNVLKEKNIQVDEQIISKCKSSVSKISNEIDQIELNSFTKKFLKVAAICIFFFLVSKDASSQSMQSIDSTEVQMQKTSGFKTKIIKSSTSIDCFEYDNEGAYHIVEVPELSKTGLKSQLEKNINELRIKVLRKSLGNISQIKYNTWSPDEIRGDIQFNISPRDRSGVTEAQFVIIVKNGKYRAEITNVKFIQVGQQRPGSPNFSDPIRNPERYQMELKRENERWSKSSRVRKECDRFFLSLLNEFNPSTLDF